MKAEDHSAGAPKPWLVESTWRTKDRKTWNRWQHILTWFDVLPSLTEEYPAPKPTDKVPYYPVWRQHAFIFPRAIVPVAIHWAWMQLTGWTFHPVFAFFFYSICLQNFIIRSVRKFDLLAKKYGYFDAKNARDGVPDLFAGSVFRQILGATALRPMLALMLAYNRTEIPSLSIWFPVQLFAFATLLDFFFYIYHRSMHEVPFLWSLHAMHHRTKHPNSLLSGFADHIQEFGDVVLIPILTWLVFPVNFSTWYMCSAYILYTEAMGHSGVRVYWQTPTTGFFLRPFDADLCLEDHDIHHRHGWKHFGGNYGKQTRLWDRIFGTSKPRIEGKEHNIDFGHVVQ